MIRWREGLCPQRLTAFRLALSHNPRIALPLEIGQCDRLRYLNLRWNKLQHFPEAVR